jgi:hypothetical protein
MARKNNYSFLGGVDERDAKTMISKLKAQDKRLTKKIGGKRAKYKIAPIPKGERDYGFKNWVGIFVKR